MERRLGRIGLHHQFSPNSQFVASAIYQNLRNTETESFSIFDPANADAGGFPTIYDSFRQSRQNSIARSLELQYIQYLDDFNITIGGGSLDEDLAISSELWELLTVIFPVPPNYTEPNTRPPNNDEIDPQFDNFYLYSHLALATRIDLTLGAAYERFTNTRVETDRWAPKLGLAWEPQSNLTLRAAYLEKIARPINMERTIEPTQVAGFNQLIDDIEGSEIKQFSVGIDVKASNVLRVGGEFTRRDLQVPWNFGEGYEGRDEKHPMVYLYLTATDRLGIHLSYEMEDFERAFLSPQQVVTRYTPIGFSYHYPAGAYLQAVTTYIDQEIHKYGTIETENFWNMDMVFGYRFSRDFGKFEIVCKNILNDKFRYYDRSFYSPDIQLPQFQPERQVFARFTFGF